MRLRQLAFAITTCALLSACGSGGWTPPVYSGKQESTEGVPGFENGQKKSPYVKLGQSYKVMGEWYVPRFQPDYNETGLASWYGPGFHGGKTANGEAFDKHSMTAAHKTLPLPSIVKVTMVETGKTVYVRINDRGPFSKGRIIDLSYAAAKEIGLMQKGVAKVRVEYQLAESQRFADLLAQGREPDEIDIAREVLPYAKGGTQLARAGIKDNTHRPAERGWWNDVNPVSSAQAATPREPLYSGSQPGAAPAQHVATRDLPPATLPAPTTTVRMPPASLPEPTGTMQTTAVDQSVFKVMDQPQAIVPPATPPPPNPAAAPPSASPPIHGIYVQVGTYSIESNANNMARRVSSIGQAQVNAFQRGDATLYRVRLGPYDNTEMAEEILDRTHQMGIADARFTK